MAEEQFEEILLFFFMSFMDEDKTKKTTKKQTKKRATWVRDIFKEKKQQKGTYNNLIQEMQLRDNEMFFR